MRHEDYPSCGCGPEGCIDFDTRVKCQRCHREFHPDPNTGEYCYGCQAQNRVEAIMERHNAPIYKCHVCGMEFEMQKEECLCGGEVSEEEIDYMSEEEAWDTLAEREEGY